MRRIVGVVLGCLALASGCGTQTGTATESVQVTRAYVIHGTGKLGTLHPDDFPDATTIAQGSGKSLDEILPMLATQERYDLLMSRMRRDHRDTFATEGIEGEGHFLVFTEAPPSTELQYFESLPVDTVVYTGAPGNTARLEGLMQSAIDELRSQVAAPEGPHLQARFRLRASGVVVTYDPTGHAAAELDEAETRIREALRRTYGDEADLVTFERDPEVRVYEAE